LDSLALFESEVLFPFLNVSFLEYSFDTCHVWDILKYKI
jgi:hypothetical protein